MDASLESDKDPTDYEKLEEITQESAESSETPATEPKSVSGFSEEEQRMVNVHAAAYAQAAQIVEDRRIEREEKLAAEALANQPAPVVIEPYHQRYFFTRAIPLVIPPILAFILIAIVSFLVQQALTRAESPQVTNALTVEVVLMIVCGWLVLRQGALALFSTLYVDEKVFDPAEPRILWLGLVGSKSAFKVAEISITNYYESFWNFPPGWNSWVLEMDTASQKDEKIQILKNVKDGDYIVAIVSPDAKRSKKSLFNRR